MTERMTKQELINLQKRKIDFEIGLLQDRLKLLQSTCEHPSIKHENVDNAEVLVCQDCGIHVHA